MSITTGQLLDLAGDYARRVLVDQGGSLMPCWVLVSRDNRMDIVGTPWGSDEQKAHIVERMRRKMRQDKIAAYSLVVEAWAAVAPRGWEPGKPIVRPSERVDRYEVVVACASTGQEPEWRQWKMRRDWLDRVVELEPEEMQGKSAGGWMGSLLDCKDIK